MKCPINTEPEKSIAPGLKNLNGDRAYANRSAYVTKLVPTHLVRAQILKDQIRKDKVSSQVPKRIIRFHGIRYCAIKAHVPGGSHLESIRKIFGCDQEKRVSRSAD